MIIKFIYNINNKIKTFFFFFDKTLSIMHFMHKNEEICKIYILNVRFLNYRHCIL